MDINDIVNKIKANAEVGAEIDEIISSSATGSEITSRIGYFLKNDLGNKYKKLFKKEIHEYLEYCNSIGLNVIND